MLDEIDRTLEGAKRANRLRREICEKLNQEHFVIKSDVAANAETDASITIQSTDNRFFDVQICAESAGFVVFEQHADETMEMLKTFDTYNVNALLSYLRDAVPHIDHNSYFKDKAKGIAAALTLIDAGSSWELVEKDISNYMQLKNTAAQYEEIYINDSLAGKGKYQIGGSFPWINGRAPSVTKHVSIGVGDSKAPEAIAKDISKRMLGEYRAALAACIEYELQVKNHQDSRIELAKQLNRLMGSEWAPYQHFDMQQGTPTAKPKYPYGPLEALIHQFEITVNSTTSIDLKLQLKNPEAAKAITKLIMLTLEDAAKTMEERAASTHNIPDQAFIDAARATYVSDIEIDSNAEVSRGDSDGAYVQGWLWVSNADAEEHINPRTKRDGTI